MNIPDEIRPLPGRSIKSVITALLRWVQSQELIAGSGVRLTQTPHGTFVNATRQPGVGGGGFAHPFRVRRTGATAITVTPGTVSTYSPWILDGADTRKLEETETMDLDPPGEPVSYVGIYLLLQSGFGSFPSEEAENFNLHHQTDVGSVAERIPDGESRILFYPLAEIEWDEQDQIVRADQITHFNLRHALQINSFGNLHYVHAA